ncbi:GerMN domain-containing protein [Spiractinospora alimapuensis]|uniref:LpqB family beta-propeller domain-containing protein n=1 Tax=Spiractinospora alimapuensis TaxID=2820884 RepID=UPI001F2D5094|nr:LpqB family beta-propeller domain-containing protein [Spiractinospora alimapuensis]QVQ54361.1 GerMN domain-containing protein [Spiractinospora alimapuensis]
MIRTRRGRGVVAVACALGVLTGCASIPTSGPVSQGQAHLDPDDQGDPFVRLVPVPPQPGVTPSELVREFLASMGSFENEFRAARAFMTPDQQSEWRPDDTALVYDGQEPMDIDVVEMDEDEGTAEVVLSANQVATVAADGQFRTANEGAQVEATLALERVNDEWRIAALPDELLLSSHDVERAYRSLNLYFFAPSGTLVPDNVLLPQHSTEDLVHQLTNHLLAGPTDWLAPAVSTSFPAHLQIATAYQSGQLTVDLGGEVEEASGEQRFQMAAQLAWTLKQLPEVQEFRMRVDGEDINIPGAGSGWLETADPAWNGVDPSGLPEGAPGYLAREGALVRFDEDLQETPVEGEAGTGHVPVERYAVDLDEERVAGVAVGKEEVLVADMAEGADFEQVLADGTYGALSWDAEGDLWVVEDRSEGEDEEVTSQVWLLRDGTDPVRVNAPELEDAEIPQLRASRDGSRVAALVRDGEETQLVIGRVVDDGDSVFLGEFIPLATDLDEYQDVAWRTADQLAVLGRSGRGAMQAYLVSAGGGVESTSAGAVTGAGMMGIDAAPGVPILAGVDDGHVWLTNDRLMWQRVAEGSRPVYPG